MKITWGDVLAVAGLVLVLAAAFLYDWRLLMAAAGLLLMILGMARIMTEPAHKKKDDG